MPFGEEVYEGRQGYGGDSVRQRFTGYERDSETNLDYAQARYYASIQGRFSSPDPLLASGRPAQPQTWNRYSYVLNNPLRMTDPTGMASGDAQQQQSPPPPPPAQIVVPVDYVKQMIGQFYTCTQPCEEGSPQVPVADDVQEKM